MIKQIKFLIAVVSFLPLSLAHAIDGDPNTNKVKADDPLQYSVVALLSPLYNPTHQKYWNYDALCTGTLITQDIVLTAAHCVYHLPTQTLVPFQDSYSSMRIAFFNESSDDLIGLHSAMNSIPVDAYIFDQRILIDQNFDMALVHLSKPAPAPYKPMPIMTDDEIQAVLTAKAANGSSNKIFNVAGYGADGIFEGTFRKGTMDYEANVTNRGFDNKITDLFSNVIFSFDTCTTDEGDSGGPFYSMVGTVNPVAKLYAAVQGNDHGVSIASKISGYRPFLRDAIKQLGEDPDSVIGLGTDTPSEQQHHAILDKTTPPTVNQVYRRQAPGASAPAVSTTPSALQPNSSNVSFTIKVTDAGSSSKSSSKPISPNPVVLQPSTSMSSNASFTIKVTDKPSDNSVGSQPAPVAAVAQPQVQAPPSQQPKARHGLSNWLHNLFN